MGPYENACNKISDILDEIDLSGLSQKEDLLNNSVNDLIEGIEFLYTALLDINNILDNIGGL